jgi:hypothetical protein
LNRALREGAAGGIYAYAAAPVAQARALLEAEGAGGAALAATFRQLARALAIQGDPAAAAQALSAGRARFGAAGGSAALAALDCWALGDGTVPAALHPSPDAFRLRPAPPWHVIFYDAVALTLLGRAADGAAAFVHLRHRQPYWLMEEANDGRWFFMALAYRRCGQPALAAHCVAHARRADRLFEARRPLLERALPAGGAVALPEFPLPQ